MLPVTTIDRQSQFRTNTEKIDALWKHPSSKTLLWRDGEFIMSDNRAYYFTYNEIQALSEDLDAPVYLGSHLNIDYFACRVINTSFMFDQFEFLNLRKASKLCESYHFELLFYAQGVLNWHQRHKFCSYCGSETAIIQSGHTRQCCTSSCAKILYPKLDPAVIFSITNNSGAASKILLGRQAAWDEFRYSVIAGFVEPGESLEAAVKREAIEETGLKVDQIQYIASQSWPFPDSLMLGFSTETTQHEISLADQELETADWFSAQDIKTKIETGTLQMPFKVSISWHLIDRWYIQQTGHSLASVEQN